MELHRRMGSYETELALRAAQDDRAREELIRRQERNILRIASRAKHRFVTKSDDEWSVALCAFSRAIDTFERGSGGFLPYAETLIRRALIDAHRAESRFEREMSVVPEAFSADADEEAPGAVLYAVVQSSVRAADTSLRDEILAANAAFSAFGFQFFDLTSCSPKQQKTRKACEQVALALLNQPQARDSLFHTKQLPIQQLIRQYGFSKKILDQYRRYIIALVVLQTGDYPLLSGYIRDCGRGENT